MTAVDEERAADVQCATALTPFTAPVERAWQSLADELGAPFWTRPQWFRAWEALGHGPVVLLTAEDPRGRLRGVLPLVRSRSTWSAAADVHSPGFVPLAADERAVRALAAGLVAVRPAHLRLEGLRHDDSSTQALLAVLLPALTHHRERVLVHSPVLDTTGSHDAFLAGLSKNRRHQLRAASRRLEQRCSGAAQEVVHGGDALRFVLDEVLPLEASGWKGEQGTGILSDERVLRFYVGVCETAAAGGQLRGFGVRCDGRLVAGLLAVEDDHVLYALKAGVDEGFGDCSPGLLLNAFVTRWCFEQPSVERLEWLGDMARHKLCTATWERVRIDAYPPTPGGAVRCAAGGAVHDGWERAKERVPRAWRSRLLRLRAGAPRLLLRESRS